jgi:putative membrane protein
MSAWQVAIVVLVADGFDMHSDFGAGWWIVMMLGMLLFWGLIIGGAVWLIRELTHSRRTRADLETPGALLDRRFAAGEVSVEEYRERKALLADEPEQPDDPSPDP